MACSLVTLTYKQNAPAIGAGTIPKQGRLRQRRRTDGAAMEDRRRTIEQLTGKRIRARRMVLGARGAPASLVRTMIERQA